MTVLPIVAMGQTKRTVCEVLGSPALFTGKIVTLRGSIQIGFENFGLSASDCPEKKIDSLWLEYGRGPKRQPTTWCCGDMIPRDRLVLVQNSEFRRFHHYITAAKKGSYLYRVTATLTGRVDAGGSCGFGHLGAACARLVIGAVSEVVAERADGGGK